MTGKSVLIGLVAGLSLFSACSTAAPPVAPAAGASASTTAATTSGGGAAADDVIGRIAAAQAGVKTYSMDLTMTMAVLDEATTITSAGVIDQSDPANVKVSTDMEFAGMKMKMLMLGPDEMYIRMDAAGDTWMRVPKDQMSQYEASVNSTDLGAKLQEVKDSVKEVTDLGEETVDGVKTTHHRLSIDSSALSKMTGSDGEIDADSFTYDVWVDEASLVRKVSMDLQAKIDGKSLPLKVDGTMGHYNEPVTITAPPKGKIVEMPS